MLGNHLFSSLRSLAAVVAMGAAMFAGSPNGIGVANIPFDFDVNGQQMPAGKYYFSEGAFKGIVDIRDMAGRTFTVATSELGNPNGRSSSRLVFERSEIGYRMSEVWLATIPTGKGLPMKSTSLKTTVNSQPERVVLAMSHP